MLMMPLWMPTATSRPLVTWAWLTSNWLTWLASSEEVASRSNQDGLQGSPVVYISGVMPADFSLPRSVMKSAQVAGGAGDPGLGEGGLAVEEAGLDARPEQDVDVPVRRGHVRDGRGLEQRQPAGAARHVGVGLVRYGLMFCSSPAGRAPEVTGPYCSQTTSGALPPEAWLSSWALAWVMLDDVVRQPLDGDVLVRGLVLGGQASSGRRCRPR